MEKLSHNKFDLTRDQMRGEGISGGRNAIKNVLLLVLV